MPRTTNTAERSLFILKSIRCREEPDCRICRGFQKDEGWPCKAEIRMGLVKIMCSSRPNRKCATTETRNNMQFLVGTSGYSYPAWKGKFYPAKLPQKEMLRYYAERFGAVEINGSFRRLPAESDVRGWATQARSGFQFAMKAPQAITHFRRLNGVEELTEQLFRTAAVLKRKQGPILVQLPPNFKKDVSRLRAFLALIPKGAKVAFEFRHASWIDEEVFADLRRHRCAWCIADVDDSPQPQIVRTANWGYVRLRRTRYTKLSLAASIARLRTENWRHCYVFFKHEETGTGPRFAARFKELLDAAPPSSGSDKTRR
jgi:uncharacterized protein YecE (DUF72 family)